MASHYHSQDESDLKEALEQLRSHNLTALFTQTLCWQSPDQCSEAPKPIYSHQQICLPIACRQAVTVWQVVLTARVRLTASMRQQIYQDIAALTPTAHPPFIIFIDAVKTRSLWCQSPHESALYVSGQPSAIWQFRLRRLAQPEGKLFPSVALCSAVPSTEQSTEPPTEDNYETFENLLSDLCEGISGISNIADRQDYAMLTLQRLILIQGIQQQGWLDGDTWYLQTRFESAVQQGEKVFFERYLQPLYRCFALPVLERSPALQTQLGTIPFVGHWFEAHRLEQQYPAIAICNHPFEEMLGWLSEQTISHALNPWMSANLGYLLERYWAQRSPASPPPVSTPALTRELCDRTLDSFLINQLTAHTHHKADKPEKNTLNDLLFNADARLCRRLIQEILPELRLLDPACGSGNLLVALHQRLTEIFSILTGYIQQTQDTQLQIWRDGLATDPAAGSTAGLTGTAASIPPNLIQNLQKRILKHNLYGVDLSVSAAET
ncbi:MAG: hypothetical protein WBC73_19275, partial [Phormidesmis sp.]